MLRLIAVLLLIGCSPGTSKPAPSEGESSSMVATADDTTVQSRRGELREESFYSEALGVMKSYLVYLPPDYELNDARFPVVYMLHGLGGDEDDWSKMGLAVAADALSLRAIVIMLDGDDSYYANRASSVDYDACLTQPRPFGRASSMRTYCVKEARYETYVTSDVVTHVDATYRTIAKREARAIGGLSMGGFGALMLAMRHKDLFSSAASHSGVAALVYKGPFPYQRGRAETHTSVMSLVNARGRFGENLQTIFGPDMSNWLAHDPATLARTLKNGELSLYLDCGTEDELKLQHGAAYLHDILDERGIAHAFALIPGRHNPQFWASRIDHSLRFHQRHFEGVEPTANSIRPGTEGTL